MPTPTIVLGTHNRNKGGELQSLLQAAGIKVATLADFPGPLVVEETGQTFAENARLKATRQARHLGEWVLGEDSGLEVDARDGAPGVYSARFAGLDASDEDNNRELLVRLGKTPLPQRTARYVCWAVFADPQGDVQAEASGTCSGRIRQEPVGTAGFGYDPLFEIVEYHRTFGELGEAVKSCLSHRARAMRQLVPQIVELVAKAAS